MILISDKLNEEMSKDIYVALGSFDGVHKGHLLLIDEIVNLAEKKQGKSMVYTFKNHPLSIIDKNKTPKILLDNKSKEEILESLGVDILCLKEFNNDLMKLSPEAFIENLVNEFNIKGIVVGFNYRFGYKNKGDLNLLKDLSKKFNFELYIKKAYTIENEIVSSTRIRELISLGRIKKANEMLGREYVLRGEVVGGRRLGRTIGFPTANLKPLDSMLIPKIGVYYTNVEVQGEIYKGITSVGNNPTVNGKNTTIETYILNFDKDIYSETIKVYFIDKIRDEKKFSGLDELKIQLEKDKTFAKNQSKSTNL
ncbi:MAG: bifunctional riboflavin kinase/FAD synthetase [Clostridium perfringens]|nr:bifunctional riboflavin kinase/FAD synthetase [Clostridium perfringens]